MAHTPGPWEAEFDDAGRESTEIRAQGSLIANVYGLEDFPCITDEERTDATAEEMAANARLIAASPTLYMFAKKHADAGDLEAAKILSDAGVD